MNVSTLCLAILNFGEASGYDIRKMSTEGTFSHFVDASFSAIYPALERLESEGKVQQRTEQQIGKPARKVYEITESGRVALVAELMEPLKDDRLKSEFLLLALCAEMLPPERVAEAVDERIEGVGRMIADFEAMGSDCDHAPSHWVLDMARHMNKTKKAYLESHRDSLVALAGGVNKRTAAE
ncbi:MAG: PadR family transcriptional regulator [Pseudomonadota bacterium]